MSKENEQSRDESIRRHEERLIKPGAPTLAQQIEVWAFTHPKKDQPWEMFGGGFW